MKPPKAIDNGIFQYRISDLVEPRDVSDGLFEYDRDNKTLIISPEDGQTDFPIAGLYEFFKNEGYEKYRIKLSSTGDFTTPDGVITVTAGNLTGEQQATLNAGTWHMKVVPIQSDVPTVPDEITGVSISSGVDSVIEGNSITRTGTVEGTGNYETAGTWKRQSGSATTFTTSGNDITITGATAGTSDVFRFTADDGTFAEITIAVDEVSTTPVIENDSIDGDLIALNDIYDQTDGVNWTNNTGWPIPDTASMGDAFGVEVYPSGHQWEGRVRILDLKNNGLINVEYDDIEGRPKIVNLAGTEIEVGDDTSQLSGLSTDPEFRFYERYVPLAGKELKASIGNLQKVQIVDLMLNNLGGALPPQIWNLPECERLCINYGSEEGIFTARDAKPWNVEVPYSQKFNHWGNKFTGGIHPNVSTMTKLKSVFCIRNYFDGGTLSLDELWSLPLIEHLEISHNGVDFALPQQQPAWKDTATSLQTYSGSSHYNRNSGTQQTNVPFKITGDLPAGVGFCTKIREFKWGPFRDVLTIPSDWQNLTSLRTLTFFGSVNLTGDYPLFINKDDLPLLNTFVVRNANFNPLQNGLPSDFNTNVTGIFTVGQSVKFNGITPLSWQDSSHPNFPKNIQIWDIGSCAIGAGNTDVNGEIIGSPFAEDLSVLTNIKIFRASSNYFNSRAPLDYPNNNRLTAWKMGNNLLTGGINANIQNITSPNLWLIEYSDNKLTDYEVGSLGTITFNIGAIESGTISASTGSATVAGTGTLFEAAVSANDELMVDQEGSFVSLGYVSSVNSDGSITLGGNANYTVSGVSYKVKKYVKGLRGYRSADKILELRLQRNQFVQARLDEIILDVYENLLSREGTPYELSKTTKEFILNVSEQKTGETPSGSTEINNAIAYMEQYGQVII